MVDVIFADVAQPDQARIVGLNAHLFLKVGGGIVVSIKANCIDSTAAPEAVFAREVQKMREERMKPLEQLTLGKLFPGFWHLFLLLISSSRTLRERSLHCCSPLRPICVVESRSILYDIIHLFLPRTILCIGLHTCAHFAVFCQG
jgi:hypothetical protein